MPSVCNKARQNLRYRHHIDSNSKSRLDLKTLFVDTPERGGWKKRGDKMRPWRSEGGGEGRRCCKRATGKKPYSTHYRYSAPGSKMKIDWEQFTLISLF